MLLFRLFTAATLGLSLVWSAPAQAQNTPKPAASATQMAPSHVAAARALIETSGMSRSFVALIPDYLTQAKSTITATRPELIKDLDVVIVQLNAEFSPKVDELMQSVALSIAGRFSEAELKEITDFFRTPTGRKYVEQQPVMMDSIFGAMGDWSQATAGLVMERIRQEMAKKGHQL